MNKISVVDIPLSFIENFKPNLPFTIFLLQNNDFIIEI